MVHHSEGFLQHKGFGRETPSNAQADKLKFEDDEQDNYVWWTKEHEVFNSMSYSYSEDEQDDDDNWWTDDEEVFDVVDSESTVPDFGASASLAGFLQRETIGTHLVAEIEYFSDIAGDDENDLIANMEQGPEIVYDRFYNIELLDGSVYRLTNISQDWLDGEGQMLNSGYDTIGVKIAGDSQVEGSDIDLAGGQPELLPPDTTMTPTGRVREWCIRSSSSCFYCNFQDSLISISNIEIVTFS